MASLILRSFLQKCCFVKTNADWRGNQPFKDNKKSRARHGSFHELFK